MSAVNVPLFPEQTLVFAAAGFVEGRPYDIGDFRDLNYQIIVRGILGAGPPTATVLLQTSMDMRDWTTLATSVPFGAPANVSASAGGFLRYVRARIDSAGTNVSVTISVLGIAKD